jgi:hypothetical protein
MTGLKIKTIKTSADAAPPERLDKSGPAAYQDQNHEYRELKKLIFLVFASLLPLMALTVITGEISGSLARS